MLRKLVIRTAFAAALPLALLAGLNPETGSYTYRHYGPEDYNASPDNWAIAQDARGIMYFGNTKGVLEFDGLNWKTIPLNHESHAKSLAVDSKGTVYVGGQGDFGYLAPDKAGVLRFVSLLDKIADPADRQFADVWRVLPTPAGVYFSAYDRLFRLNADGSVKVWRPVAGSNFGRAFHVPGGLYVKSRQQGLMRMEGDTLKLVPGGSLFTKFGVTAAVPFDGGALIATPARLFLLSAGGVEPFPTAADSWFVPNILNTLQTLPGGEIAAGTRNGGIVLLDRQGAIDRFLTKQDGLPGDYIVSIFPDSQGGVWLAGVEGLTRFNPGLSRFEANLGLEGAVQCMARQNGAMYVGSTAGLFRMTSSAGMPPTFEKVEGINNTVWTLLPRPGQLIAGTDTGVFAVTGTRAAAIFQGAHAEPFLDLSASLRVPDAIYAASKTAIFRLLAQGKAWEKTAEYSVPGQEFRTVLEDADGKLWATTRENVYRVDLSGDTVRAEKFGEEQGAPVGWKNARHFRGRVVFATPQGLRRFDEKTKRFKPDNSLGDEFANGTRDVFNIFDNPAGEVWVTGETYHGVLRPKSGGGYRWEPMRLLSSGIREIYWASLDDDGTVWAAGAKGVLYRWNRAASGDPGKDFHVMTRLVQILGSGETLYGGAGLFESLRLPWNRNALRFQVAAPFYEDGGAVEYQWQLEGGDRTWSKWSSHETRQDYNYLPEGSYRFRARARTPQGAWSEQNPLSFGVLPPWYRSWWAYAIYVVLGGFAVWGLVKSRTRQLERDKRNLENIVEERTVEIREQRDEIRMQERKSHSLLLNILPATVADELKSTGVVQPVGFDDVTVCFTDFVGFTLSSEKMPPSRLVDALNEYFTAFDEIVARYGLEKLKTIGDSYMFASGLPTPRGSHAVDAVLAALEMVEAVKRLAVKEGGTGWGIRVGLHSGPVVAGVVGIRKFAFDIWGNTVNFAARMESSGVPGNVNMSERTCGLLGGLIECEPRGKVKIKEGRELNMFLAMGPVPDFAARYEAAFGEEPRTLPQLASGELTAF